MNIEFNLNKKQEYEQQAAQALELQNYCQALFFAAKAAELTYRLAEQSAGSLRAAYANQASALVQQAQSYQLAAKRQEQIRKQQLLLEQGSEQELGSPWRLDYVPDISLEDVAGLDEVKLRLQQDVILPLQHKELYDSFRLRAGSGILLYGPPGNGKTYIAKAIAGSLDATFFSVDAASIKSKYLGKTEKNMRQLFIEAKAEARAVIFFDEVDALLKKGSAHDTNAVKQFLIATDGVARDTAEGNMLLILAATNNPWALPPAVLRPGRLGHQILVTLPDLAARQAIWQHSLKGVPIGDDLCFMELAELTAGFSAADVVAVSEMARKNAVSAHLHTDAEAQLERCHLLDCIAVYAPSVNPEQEARYLEWQ